MFVAFDPFTLLAIVFLCFFVPGALLSFGLFRKEDFLFIEKAFVGFGIAWVAIPAIPFLLYFFLGITYTYELALGAVGLFYLIAIAVFAYTRTYEDVISYFREAKFKSLVTGWKKLGVPLFLLILLFVSFWIRFGSYSPIYQELDPYFYTDVAQQLLTMGYNPLDDQTAWYPELEVDHRIIPELSYLEAIWYSIYNGSNDYDNMLLADIASVYPPIAAMMAVFFLYFLIACYYKREYGIIGAGIAAFAPMFIFKLMGGEQEVQPYAFFALAFFYAMYALMITRKEMKYAVIAGIAYFGVCLGSSSEVLAIGTVIVFTIIYGLVIYLREENANQFRELLKLHAVMFLIGVVLGSSILKGLFYNGVIGTQALFPAIAIMIFFGILMVLKEKAKQYSPKLVVGALVVIGIIVILSPLGAPLKNIGSSGFGVAEFRSPLYRTIAEQGTAGGFLYSSMGFVAVPYENFGVQLVSPLVWLIETVLTPVMGAESAGTLASPLTTLGEILGTIMGYLFWVITAAINLMFAIGVGITNMVLGTSVDYSDKGNSLLFLWIFLFALAFIYSVWRNKDNKIAIPLLFAILIFPPFLVGILKAKYTIYAAFFLGAGIAFILGESDYFLRTFKGAGKEGKLLSLELSEEKREKYAGYVMAFGFILLFLQFMHNSYAPSLLVNTFNVRYQDDPMAVQDKLQTICDETGDNTVCAAAADPMGYASLGTNYQYNGKLCMLSILSDYRYYTGEKSGGGPEMWAAQMRCHRIADYWIESMEWIKTDTESDSRTTSWWDYGHWINFFGQKNAVLRNEHASHGMIGRIAYSYIHGTPEELIGAMKEYDSKYALFDVELISSGSYLGGKYGALNYLSCAYMNRTDVDYSPGQSSCEAEHIWEIVYLPKDAAGKTCTISENRNLTGIIGYNQMSQPVYCVGPVTLADGSESTGTYYINQKTPSGDLKLNKGLLSMPMDYGNAIGYTVFYTNDRIWFENGEIVDGMDDAKGEFYDSNLYRGIFLNEIPGFEQVFDNGAVKIYKILEPSVPIVEKSEDFSDIEE